MKTRVAKKILKPDLLHFYWYGSGLWSLAPRNPQRYFKAHKVLHKKPYYDREWLSLIYKKFGRPKKNVNIIWRFLDEMKERHGTMDR